MRLWLAILALVGLLLSPVVASAATSACLRHHDGVQMPMAMDMSPTPDASKAASCCDDDAGKPVDHQQDGKSCAQFCAMICGVTAALPQGFVALSLTESHASVPPAASTPLHAHGPPGLKRPPKQDA